MLTECGRYTLAALSGILLFEELSIRQHLMAETGSVSAVQTG